MKEWRPVTTPKKNMIMFFFLGVILLAIGFFIKSSSDSNFELVKPYDVFCKKKANGKKRPRTCEMEIEIENDVKGPIYL